MQRRDVLRILGGAVLLGPRAPFVLPASGRLGPIGIQLYSLRTEMEKDFDGTLARVADIGYAEVEFAGYFDRTPAQVAAALRRAKLGAPSAHIPIELLNQDWPKTLSGARTMGHRYLIVPWLPDADRATAEGVKRLARLFERAGKEAKAAGIRLGFHNHDVDFVPFAGKPGGTPLDVLLQQTDPDHVTFELDLYWITKARRDPLRYFEQYPGRFELVHVKDSAGAPEHRMVSVGEGTIDFRPIFARSKQAGIRHYFVEHDQPEVPFEFARTSYHFLRRLEF